MLLLLPLLTLTSLLCAQNSSSTPSEWLFAMKVQVPASPVIVQLKIQKLIRPKLRSSLGQD
jgi:hypothetical protein